MLRINVINEKPMNLFFVGILSCFFGIMILQYGYKASTLLIFISFVLVFFIRVEYVFYFLLASRSIVDILFDVEAAGGIRLTHSIAILVITLFVLYFIISGYNYIFKTGVNKTYWIFISLAIIPLFLTQNIVSGFTSWLRLLQTILILNMVVLIILKDEGKLYKDKVLIICWMMLISLIIPYILFLRNFIQGTHIVMGGYIRYSDFGSYANLFSYYLFTAFPVSLFLYSISQKRSGKIFWFFIMLIMLLTIYKTYTRNVWIGTAIIILAWNLLRKNLKVVFPILILFVIKVLFDSNIHDRFSEISEIFSSDSLSNLDPKLLSHRVSIWVGNLDYFFYKSTFLEKLFGNGFDVNDKILRFVGPNRIGASIEEHNNFLTLLMNTGICGLFLYYFFIFMLFRESFKLLRRTKDMYLKNLAQVFISILFAYVIMGLFTHMIWKIHYQYYFASLAGLIVAANILEDKRQGRTANNL
jgi:hypothetical protein